MSRGTKRASPETPLEDPPSKRQRTLSRSPGVQPLNEIQNNHDMSDGEIEEGEINGHKESPKEKEKSKSKSNSKSKERSSKELKEKERQEERMKRKPKEQKSKDKDKEKEKDKDKYKHKQKDKEKDRDRERSKRRDSDKYKDKDKERDKNDRSSKHKSGERNRSHSRDLSSKKDYSSSRAVSLSRKHGSNSRSPSPSNRRGEDLGTPATTGPSGNEASKSSSKRGDSHSRSKPSASQSSKFDDMLKDYKSHYLGSNDKDKSKDKYDSSRGGGDKKHRSGSNSASNGRKTLNHYQGSKSAILDNRDLIKEAQKWIGQNDHGISEREYQKNLQQEMSLLNSVNAKPELSFEEQRKQRMERLKRLELKQKACADTMDKKVNDHTPQAQPTTPQLNIAEDKHTTTVSTATTTAGPTSSCTIIPTVDVNGISASTIISAIGNGPTEQNHCADSDSKISNDNGSIHTLNNNDNNNDDNDNDNNNDDNDNDNNNNDNTNNDNNNNNNNNNMEVVSASLPASTTIDIDADVQANGDPDDEKTKNARITAIAKHMISSDAYDELQVAHSGKNDEGFDLFSESLDFEKEIVKQTTVTRSVDNNLHLTENWDDSEGYYVFRLNDRIKDSYEVVGNQGRGVFSTVLRVRYLKNNEIYVIKVIRNNETMFKAGQKEIDFLLSIKNRDSDNSKHCIRLLDHFEYRNHLCLVFEPMECNLRQLLKKVGAGKGFSINAVYSYAKQLMKALQLLSSLGIVHVDIKPDNILVSENRKIVKLCDFGSGYKLEDVEITPIIGSRYYRAPEVMIGLHWDCGVDMWSMACCLFELYTGKILFAGDTNNHMLKLHCEMVGKFPVKVGKKGLFWSEHFDDCGRFLEDVVDSVSGLQLKEIHNFTQPTRDLMEALHPNGTDEYNRLPIHERKKVNEFRDLLKQILILDPAKRITPEMALKHPFCKNPMKKLQ